MERSRKDDVYSVQTVDKAESRMGGRSWLKPAAGDVPFFPSFSAV